MVYITTPAILSSFMAFFSDPYSHFEIFNFLLHYELKQLHNNYFEYMFTHTYIYILVVHCSTKDQSRPDKSICDHHLLLYLCHISVCNKSSLLNPCVIHIHLHVTIIHLNLICYIHWRMDADLYRWWNDYQQ